MQRERSVFDEFVQAEDFEIPVRKRRKMPGRAPSAHVPLFSLGGRSRGTLRKSQKDSTASSASSSSSSNSSSSDSPPNSGRFFSSSDAATAADGSSSNNDSDKKKKRKSKEYKGPDEHKAEFFLDLNAIAAAVRKEHKDNPVIMSILSMAHEIHTSMKDYSEFHHSRIVLEKQHSAYLDGSALTATLRRKRLNTRMEEKDLTRELVTECLGPLYGNSIFNTALNHIDVFFRVSYLGSMLGQQFNSMWQLVVTDMDIRGLFVRYAIAKFEKSKMPKNAAIAKLNINLAYLQPMILQLYAKHGSEHDLGTIQAEFARQEEELTVDSIRNPSAVPLNSS